MKIIHQSHLGIVKTKSILRTKVYWNGLDKDIETFIKTCQQCQKISKPSKPTPVTMTELPTSPWEIIAADFYGPLPTGEKILAIIDLYSKFPIVEVLKSTKFPTVADRLSNIFSLFGYPHEMKTDNGPPWDSNDFSDYLKERNIKYTPSIPLWPRSNGQVERFMPSITKTIQHLVDSKTTDWKNPLRAMLLNYRNTVHPATGKTPAELFLNRETNFGIPSIQKPFAPDFEKVKQHHDEYRQKAKTNADKHCEPNKYTIKEGDLVFLKNPRPTKFQTKFFKETYKVLKIEFNMITLTNENGQKYRRHISFVKPVYPSTDNPKPVYPSTGNPKKCDDENVNRKKYPLRNRSRK